MTGTTSLSRLPPANAGQPPAEVEVTADMARRLLDEQHPDLASQSLVEFDSGWDNTLFRLGSRLLLRLPRRKLGAAYVAHEVALLPALAHLLPLPIPAPIRVGTATSYYPFDWSIVPLLPGRVTALGSLGSRSVRLLAGFLSALHGAPTDGAPLNPYRGVPLASLEDRFKPRLARLQDEGRVSLQTATALGQVFGAAAQARPARRRTLIHGDLHPFNLLSFQGELAAVLDFGDLCLGDPATDIAVLWQLFPNPAHPTFLSAYAGSDDPDLLLRARGWAAHLSLIYLEAGMTKTPLEDTLEHTLLDRILDDPLCRGSRVTREHAG